MITKTLDPLPKWIIKPCTIKDLTKLYDLSYKVLKNHINAHETQIGKRIGRVYMTSQVINIIKTFGPPCTVEAVMPDGSRI